MRWLAWGALWAALSASGCDCSSDSGTTKPCESSSDCPAGESCRDGHCVAVTDSGPSDSGGADRGEMCIDADGDHHAAIGSCTAADDCDDTDAMAHPGAGELCGNGLDDDCDGTIDEPDCSCRRG